MTIPGMEAYVHVQARGQKVGVGVVIRDGYETLSVGGWLHPGVDRWQAMRDAIEGLVASGQELLIHCRAGDETGRVDQRKVGYELHDVETGQCRLITGYSVANTGPTDAKAQAHLHLGVVNVASRAERLAASARTRWSK